MESGVGVCLHFDQYLSLSEIPMYVSPSYPLKYLGLGEGRFVSYVSKFGLFC
jgi:hypothetical protein